MSELAQAIEEMRNMRESYDQLAEAAEAYNEGKPALAEAITAKGVETAATDSLATMAEKVMTISQDTYEIDGGEMYAKQLSGVANNDIVPGYWNLYDILAQLLSDGRLVNYGGILLAEYYKGYDSLALAGAGAGGAYVVSDKDSDGNFIMYTEDTTHTWATEDDGKGNRWVAYCFANEYHDFEITNTSTSPRSIFIGRKVGTVKNLANSRVSQIIVPDGSSLLSIAANNYTNQYDKKTIFRNIENLNTSPIYGNNSIEQLYIQAQKVSGASMLNMPYGTNTPITTVLIDCPDFNGYVWNGGNYSDTVLYQIIIKSEKCSLQPSNYNLSGADKLKLLHVIDCEEANLRFDRAAAAVASHPMKLVLDYKTNDKTKAVRLLANSSVLNAWVKVEDVVLRDGWCKPIGLYLCTSLTKENVQAHIFDRLGVNDLSTGAITISLASSVLNLFTQEEIDAVVARTNITIVGA